MSATSATICNVTNARPRSSNPGAVMNFVSPQKSDREQRSAIMNPLVHLIHIIHQNEYFVQVRGGESATEPLKDSTSTNKEAATVICPVCKNEMQEGYLHNGSQPVQWSPKTDRPSPFSFSVAPHAVILRNTFRLFKRGGYSAVSFYCSHCMHVISPVKNDPQL